MTRFHMRAALVLTGTIFITVQAMAQEEIPPPQGKGRVVVLASGMDGPEDYRQVGGEIAKLGYDVVLFDSKQMLDRHGEGLKTAIQHALAMPHALPGKVGLVGFSLGGGIALAFGSTWSDQVAVDIVWYPVTNIFRDFNGFAALIKVPVVMFAGESDSFHNCCLIENARRLETAAKTQNAPYELITYPDTDHAFMIGGDHYNPQSYSDAFAKTAAALKQYLGN